MTVSKPESIKRSDFKSAKWDEITSAKEFSPSDVPALTLLCQWYEIAEQCMDDLDFDGEIQIVYSNKLDDIKEMPQINTLKKASAEIRALNKQLGINDEATEPKPKKETPLYVIQGKRARKAGAAHSA